MRSEVDRYLGWPGQAISYKVGERVWLAARDAARQQAGDAFDLKAFHAPRSTSARWGSGSSAASWRASSAMDVSCAFPPGPDVVEHVVVAESLGYERAWLYDSPALYPDVWVTLPRASPSAPTASASAPRS